MLGLVGAGSVLVHQVFQRPVFRQASAVGNVQLIFVHTDLDRHAGLILLVAQGVQQGFPQLLPAQSTGSIRCIPS